MGKRKITLRINEFHWVTLPVTLRLFFLDCIYDFLQVFQIYILVVSQHFRTRVPDQFHLIFVRRDHFFHQGGKCVPARVRRIFVDPVYHWVLNADGFQRWIKNSVPESIIRKLVPFFITEQSSGEPELPLTILSALYLSCEICWPVRGGSMN